MKKNLLHLFAPLAILFLLNTPAFATHNRAGEIVIEQIGGCTSNTVRCSLIVYTKTTSPVNQDRGELVVHWGDGESEAIPRVNGNGSGEQLPNDVSISIYTTTHTYPGPGHYTVSMTDPKRNGGILNVNNQFSDVVDFYIETSFTLFTGQSQGCNSTPRLDNPPIGYACIGETYIHNPGAFDQDGDSLSYELVVPLQGPNSPVPVYIFPQNIPGSSDTSSLSMDAAKGDLVWKVPEIAGEYNVAFAIISWRNGQPIDTTIRDMQIEVYSCDDNQAPRIETIDEICIVAGEVVEFQVIATDPNPGDKIKLSATGAPFLMDVSPATNAETWRPFGNPAAEYEDQPVVKTFRWQTACEHISDLPYTVVFRAEDDYFLDNNLGGLAFSKSVRIKVVGPPPLDVQAQPMPNQIEVSWGKPYRCENAADDFFLSFSIWRKEGGDNLTDDDCEPGLAGTGYVRLANTLDEANGRYFYNDVDVERGRTYCYRILARFAKRTDNGSPYNIVESLKSQKICLQLNRDVPLITHVTVNETSTNNGEIEVRWVKPAAADLDTLLNPGPYRYELLRAQGLNSGSFQTVASFSSPTFFQLTQNSFTDQTANLNTKSNPYHYRLAFFADGEPAPLGQGSDASSVFLDIQPTDNRNDLSWDFDVPWTNYQYAIFRWNGSAWDSIAVTIDPFYSDMGLVNGREYCYFIKAYGSYSLPDVPDPLINFSQEACAVPVDDVPPCPPVLLVENLCDKMTHCDETDNLENRLLWENPMLRCAETDDVVSYNIYYSPFTDGEFELVGSVGDANDTTFLHSPDRGLAGCYAVTALDTFLNESLLSNVFCVDNCPNYSLPNTFTPNGDGKNDLFTPYPFCFIEYVEMAIFNRWGQLVFETRDPNIRWAGENLRGDDLPAGTYYYTCRVFEQRVSGTVEGTELLNGWIDLLR